ncbi:unnamed protein product [Microthlaspi erraticum]|uniref:Lipid desaturase domain-containing protein n=1 Tax=Microthlaspi erraticum TaxID=1685480 RepID=A0A6D2IEC6_9BRAS|nr:unnamed protein product [Microthlaspi erraticum]
METLQTKYPNSEKPVVERRFVDPPKDPALHSTWSHRFWVAAGCITVLASFAKSIIGGFKSHLWLEPALASYAGYILADLGAGVYHWAIDNYGDESTPLFGTQIEAFQGHHKWPWIIVRQQFAVRLNVLARTLTFTVLPLVLVFNDPVVHGFVSSFAFCILFSQQFHAWAHETKSKLPRLVVALQDMGLILSRRQHAEHHRAHNSSYCIMSGVWNKDMGLLVSRTQHVNHHRAPYNNNYCVVSGVWNKVLDENKFFEALEMVLSLQLGVRPISWTGPKSEWSEETVISNNNQA